MKSGTDPFTVTDLSLLGVLALDGGQTDPYKQDDLAYANDSQISEKVNLPVGCGHVCCTVSTYTDIQAYPSSPTSTNIAGKRASEAPERPYFCDICDKHYSQPQGVSRHRREAHGLPYSCLYCNSKWSRPYQYRIHLEKWHPDVDADDVLGKPAGSRCRSAISIRRDPHLPAPVTEPARRNRTKPQRRPMRPLPAVAKVTRIPLPVAYDPQPECAETEITACKSEDASELEIFGTTDAPSEVLSTEERAQSANDVGTSVQRGPSLLVQPYLTYHH